MSFFLFLWVSFFSLCLCGSLLFRASCDYLLRANDGGGMISMGFNASLHREAAFVNFDMRSEICGSSESLATGRARKGFLSGVDSFMYGQVTLVGKCFVTLCADKGPFSGVYSQM